MASKQAQRADERASQDIFVARLAVLMHYQSMLMRLNILWWTKPLFMTMQKQRYRECGNH